MTKLHYFDQDAADEDDVFLSMAKMQGYVPETCLLGGIVVMAEVSMARDACWGCNGPRDKCDGRPKQEDLCNQPSPFPENFIP